MSNIVYYLSFYREQLGFLFPDELPKNYYSPGLFIVEEKSNGELPYSYSFDAMYNSKRVSLNLVRVDEGNPSGSLYVVKAKHYGSFWFKLDRVNPLVTRYQGNRPQLQSHNPFRVAVTTDSAKLERICQKFDFYFIGSTLKENDL